MTIKLGQGLASVVRPPWHSAQNRDRRALCHGLLKKSTCNLDGIVSPQRRLVRLSGPATLRDDEMLTFSLPYLRCGRWTPHALTVFSKRGSPVPRPGRRISPRTPSAKPQLLIILWRRRTTCSSIPRRIREIRLPVRPAPLLSTFEEIVSIPGSSCRMTISPDASFRSGIQPHGLVDAAKLPSGKSCRFSFLTILRSEGAASSTRDAPANGARRAPLRRGC